MNRNALARSGLYCVAIMIGVGVAPLGLAEVSAATKPDEHSEAAVKANYSNKLICKRQRQTGSHIPRSVCRTQAQIDADHAAAVEFMREENRQQGLRLPTIQQLPPMFD